jgi:hypothetical protein
MVLRSNGDVCFIWPCTSEYMTSVYHHARIFEMFSPLFTDHETVESQDPLAIFVEEGIVG